MLSRFHLTPERYGRTYGQICYINIAHQHTALLTRDKKHKYDLTYRLYAEMSSAAYCKVMFVIFLS